MLVKTDKNCTLWPDYVAVIGGGRWARVLLDVLCSITPEEVKVYVYSPRNFTAMAEWVLNRGLEKRIQVNSDYSKTILGARGSVIVANSACDHERAIEWALHQRLPVLVEKPATPNFLSTQRMVAMANSKQTYFATAHIFLFASYIEAFAKLVSNQGSIVSIHMLWADPKIESRYGEEKKYDPGLPIYADLLPHILSILSTIIDVPSGNLESIEFLRGGACIKINLLFDQIPCVIEIARNVNSRQRIIKVETEIKVCALDFCFEPGVIYFDGHALCGDKEWDCKPKPVASMLTAFLKTSAGDVYDARLDNSIGLSISRFIDQVAIHYQADVWAWLKRELENHTEDMGIDIHYALSEIMQMNDSNSPVSLDQRINYCYKNLKKLIQLSNNISLMSIDEAIELIIKKGKYSAYL